jgi:hypothetical protein
LVVVVVVVNCGCRGGLTEALLFFAPVVLTGNAIFPYSTTTMITATTTATATINRISSRVM